EEFGVNVAGEGGEYETLVLGGPNFKYDFKIVKSKKNWDGKRGTLNVEEIERV
ncbi:MAG: TIGR00289 family protein, partial [Thermoplasmatota archaeon]